MLPLIRIIGVPMDLGQSLRGVDMGPSALRYAGLAERLERLGYRVEDAGNVEVAVRGTIRDRASGMDFLPQIVSTCERIYAQGQQAIADGCLPLFLGGDHSMSIGTVGGISDGQEVGVLWIDAHGDYNTPETSPTGNIHGMPLAVLTGLGAPELVHLGRPGAKVKHENVVYIGLRDIDVQERKMLRESGMGLYTMREIDELGIANVAHQALKRLRHLERIHLSLDMDSLDPMYAPGVGTPVPGGLTFREAHLLMEILADDDRVASVDVVEVNPILDDKNRTALAAADLVASLLGKSIL
jgi:arginase